VVVFWCEGERANRNQKERPGASSKQRIVVQNNPARGGGLGAKGGEKKDSRGKAADGKK